MQRGDLSPNIIWLSAYPITLTAFSSWYILIVAICEGVMRVAKIFKNGPSQAVRLPKEFRFEGDEVFIRRIGNAVVLFPKLHPWGTLIESLNMFSDDYFASREQPEQFRERI